MSAHTPGPWRVAKGARRLVETVEAAVGGLASEVIATCSMAPTIERGEANALLIAAAPELLEAAKQAMAVWPEHMRGSTLEAAIAKAEGR